jgi:mannan endo-1,4-beta-mannosidase
MKKTLLVILPVFGLIACNNTPIPTDREATKETVKLYQNLLALQKTKMMFGHQDALAYGHGWFYEEGRSDVKDVCGDYPAVYGWEIGHLELGDRYSLDSVHFDKIQNWIKLVNERGGINTVSWHLRNPLTGGSSWDASSRKVVNSILPGGEKNGLFKEYLDKLADFMLALKTEDGSYIPILFRPFHEHTGSWFWWGKDLCSVDDYKALWRFTVDYLQNEKGIHHLLYIYSSDGIETPDEYLERYPGDDIIDVLGFDLYDRGEDYTKRLERCAEIVSILASDKGKVATVSETGSHDTIRTYWWTNSLMETLRPFDLSYVLVWRNPWKPIKSHGNFAPYPGSPDSKDFMQFYHDPKTMFQKELTALRIYN